MLKNSKISGDTGSLKHKLQNQGILLTQTDSDLDFMGRTFKRK